MRSSRRASSARSSRRQQNNTPELPEDESNEKTVMCRAWARFIADASAAIEEPFWYLAAGQHRKSLLFLTMLDTRKFCALLLACGLVSCKRKDDGSIRVDSSEGMWRGFWDRYQLGSGSNGPYEVTKGEFYHDALRMLTPRKLGCPPRAGSKTGRCWSQCGSVHTKSKERRRKLPSPLMIKWHLLYSLLSLDLHSAVYSTRLRPT